MASDWAGVATKRPRAIGKVSRHMHACRRHEKRLRRNRKRARTNKQLCVREEEEEERAPDGGMPLDFCPLTAAQKPSLEKGEKAQSDTHKR
jgi:hypothetical protein